MKPQEKIVTLRKKQLTTTSEIIAERCGVEHRATIQLVRKYLDDFQEFGLLAFEMRARLKGKHGGGDTEYAVLNEPQATYLITLLRNTDIVRRFKLELVKEFTRMKSVLNDPNRANAIKHKRAAHNPMMDAVIYAHDLAGIEPPGKMDFISENLLCNMAVTGNWAAAKEVELDSYELKMLEVIRYHNGILVQHNISIADRVMKLKAFAENYRKKHPHLKLLK